MPGTFVKSRVDIVEQVKIFDNLKQVYTAVQVFAVSICHR